MYYHALNKIKEEKGNCQRADVIWIWIRCMSTLMTGFMPIITKAAFIYHSSSIIRAEAGVSGEEGYIPFWITA